MTSVLQRRVCVIYVW